MCKIQTPNSTEVKTKHRSAIVCMQVCRSYLRGNLAATLLEGKCHLNLLFTSSYCDDVIIYLFLAEIVERFSHKLDRLNCVEEFSLLLTATSWLLRSEKKKLLEVEVKRSQRNQPRPDDNKTIPQL